MSLRQEAFAVFDRLFMVVEQRLAHDQQRHRLREPQRLTDIVVGHRRADLAAQRSHLNLIAPEVVVQRNANLVDVGNCRHHHVGHRHRHWPPIDQVNAFELVNRRSGRQLELFSQLSAGGHPLAADPLGVRPAPLLYHLARESLTSANE